MELKKVLEKYQGEMIAVKGVVGVGEGMCDGKPCVKVFVVKKTSQILTRIPSVIEGYTVSIVETGVFKALR